MPSATRLRSSERVKPAQAVPPPPPAPASLEKGADGQVLLELPGGGVTASSLPLLTPRHHSLLGRPRAWESADTPTSPPPVSPGGKGAPSPI